MNTRKSVKVAIDQGVNLKQLKKLQAAGTITLYQVHDLEQLFRKVQPHGRAATYGVSTYGGPDMYADEKMLNAVLTIVGKQNALDAQHLYAARLNGCEYFVTENPDDLISAGKREKLESLLGVKIRRTGEFMTEITPSHVSEKDEEDAH